MHSVLITGGTRGIGLAVVNHFLLLGDYNVTFTGTKQESVDKTLNGIPEKYHKQLSGLICDVRNDSHIERVVDNTVDQFGKIDVLVNNAGIGGGGRQLILLPKIG